MSSQPSLNTFIFSDKIDTAYIYEMYEDDYPYIESIFKSILDSFDEDITAIRFHYQTKNLQLLRSLVHKVKPTFGFAGMPTVQEKCRDFENKCQSAASTIEIEKDFRELMENLEEAGAIIKEQHQKLRSFNNSAA